MSIGMNKYPLHRKPKPKKKYYCECGREKMNGLKKRCFQCEEKNS